MAVTLVKETGAGLTNANAYTDVTEAAALLETHPDYAAYWVGLTADQKAIALIKAAEWLDNRFRWYGAVKTTTQAMQWPRTKVYDSHGVIVAAGSMPIELRKANAYIATQWAKEITLYNTVQETGIPKSIGLPGGLTLSFDPKTEVAAVLVGKRFPELENMLKNMAEFKVADWFDSRRTDVRQTT